MGLDAHRLFADMADAGRSDQNARTELRRIARLLPARVCRERPGAGQVCDPAGNLLLGDIVLPAYHADYLRVRR